MAGSEDTLPVGQRCLEAAVRRIHQRLEVLANEPRPHLRLIVLDDALGRSFQRLAELVAATPRQQHWEIMPTGCARDPREVP